MLRNLIRALIIAAVMSPALSVGAEAIKLRHVVSLYTDDKGNAFKAPEGAACTSDNALLLVADTGNGRLLKYNNQNETLIFGGEYKIPELPRPSSLQISSKGDIFAFDEKVQRITRLNAAGAFVAYVKPTGVPAPESFIPRSFTLDARDNIYVLDILAERVLVLDPGGAFVREIKFPGKYGFFSDVAVDPTGTVFLIDTVQSMVYSASSQAKAFAALTGKLKEYMLFPTNITVDGTGKMYITDRNGGAIVILDQAGGILGKQLSMGWKEGWVRYPSQVCVTAAGNLFVADRENNRVQVYKVIM